MYARSIFGTSQIATRIGVRSDAVKNVVIWGNHSSTQFPDVSHATVEVEGKTLPVYEAVKDDAWIEGDFITVSGGIGDAVVLCFEGLGILIMTISIVGNL